MAPMEYILVVLMLAAVSAKPTTEETQTQAEDPLVVGAGDSDGPTYSPGMPPFGMPPGGMPGGMPGGGMPGMPGGMPGMPSMPGGPAWGPNSDQFKMMQSRLAALKKKFDNLNETEKEALEEKAKAFREKMEGDAQAFKDRMEEDMRSAQLPPLPPPPPFLPPPMCPPCPCMEGGVEEDRIGEEELDEPFEGPHPPPLFPPYPYPPPSRQLPPWMRPRPMYHRPMGPRRSRRSLGDDWWYDIDSGMSNDVSDNLRASNPGYATHDMLNTAMLEWALPTHIGTIGRGYIAHPELGGPADRIFGTNPDFNAGDMHAFKFTPRGQYNYGGKTGWKDFFGEHNALQKFTTDKHQPFYYKPTPGDPTRIFGTRKLFGGQFLDQPMDDLKPGRYSVENIQPITDANGFQSVNTILRNQGTGQFFRLNGVESLEAEDILNIQAISPFGPQHRLVNEGGFFWSPQYKGFAPPIY
jgi:hypothetical protein